MTDVRWWWVRHGATGARGAIGQTDVPALPFDAAALVRLRLLLPPDAAVIASDLIRARQTAEALDLPGLRLPDAPELREINFGRWEGRSFDAIAAEDPAAHARFWADPGPARATGGEGFDDIAARIATLTGRLNAAPPCADIVAIAHAGSIRAALARAGLGTRGALACRIAPLSLTRIDWLGEAGQWAVDRVNHPA